MILNRLRAFISSTGDLEGEREAVASALESLEIEGSLFETWPSSPVSSISECLRRIDKSEVFILLLGSLYGHELPNGLSFTHQEYHRARELELPIFVYLLKRSDPDAKQESFIAEVEARYFRSRPIRTIDELKTQVTNAFLQEFTRCFRDVHPPPLKARFGLPSVPTGDAKLPNTLDETLRLLAQMDAGGDDVGIRRVADECERRFPQDSQVMNIVFAAEVNLGINGVEVDRDRVARAIEFWKTVVRDLPGYAGAIRYNIGNALSVLKHLDDAVEQYEAALDEQPEFAECCKNLGAVHLERGEFAKARQCFVRALDLDPQLPEALYSLSTLTVQEGGEPEAALRLLSRIATAHLPAGMAASVHGWRARIYASLGWYAEGIASAEDAISLAPEADWAWMGAARLFSLARRESSAWTESAVSFWRRFVAKHSEVADAWAELGQALWSIARCDEDRETRQSALHAFEKALELGFNDNGLVEDRIGHIHQDEGCWEDAERFYRKAATKNEALFGYCLGVSLLQLDRYEEALPLV